MKNPNEIEDFLEYYYKKYKSPFRVQSYLQTPRKWINFKGRDNKDEDWVYYTNCYSTINNREVLAAEIVLDLDYHVADASKKDIEKAMQVTLEAIKEKLHMLQLSYILWKSGGDGYHFHLFFDRLLEYNKFDRTNLKDLIVKKIAYGFLTFHEGKAKVDSPVMIQVENTKGRQKKGVKKLIEYKYYGENEIPDDIHVKFNVYKALDKFRTPIILNSNGLPPSIKFFLSNDFQSKDGKKRALFILASWFKEEGLDKSQVYDKLHDWNEYNLRGYLSKMQVMSTVNTVFNSRSRVTSRYRNKLLTEIGATEFLDK